MNSPFKTFYHRGTDVKEGGKNQRFMIQEVAILFATCRAEIKSKSGFSL